MSYQDDGSLLEHIRGLGIGTSLVVGGLVFTIGDIWLRAGIGFPLFLLLGGNPRLRARPVRPSYLDEASANRMTHDWM